MGTLTYWFFLVPYIILAYLQCKCSEILTHLMNPNKSCRVINPRKINLDGPSFFFKWRSMVQLINLSFVRYIIYFSCVLVILMYFFSWTGSYYYCKMFLNKTMFFDTMYISYCFWNWLKNTIETVYRFRGVPCTTLPCLKLSRFSNLTTKAMNYDVFCRSISFFLFYRFSMSRLGNTFYSTEKNKLDWFSKNLSYRFSVCKVIEGQSYLSEERKIRVKIFLRKFNEKFCTAFYLFSFVEAKVMVCQLTTDMMKVKLSVLLREKEKQFFVYISNQEIL